VPEIGDSGGMTTPLLRAVDAVTFHVPDLDEGIAFYVDRLGHALLWRNNDIGAAGIALPESSTEIVLTTQHRYEPNWLVDSADAAAESVEAAGGRVLSPAVDIPVGRVAVVEDPFGNVLVLVDLSKGRLATDQHGNVTAVVADP
jgi:predicted enzyme related to lactoylglutathione lyase